MTTSLTSEGDRYQDSRVIPAGLIAYSTADYNDTEDDGVGRTSVNITTLDLLHA